MRPESCAYTKLVVTSRFRLCLFGSVIWVLGLLCSSQVSYTSTAKVPITVEHSVVSSRGVSAANYLVWSGDDGVTFQSVNTRRQFVFRLHSRHGVFIEYPVYCIADHCLYFWSPDDESLAIVDAHGRYTWKSFSRLVDSRPEAYVGEIYVCGNDVYLDFGNQQGASCILYKLKVDKARFLRNTPCMQGSTFSTQAFAGFRRGTYRLSGRRRYSLPSYVFRLLGGRDYVSWQYDPSQRMLYLLNISNVVAIWPNTNEVSEILMNSSGYIRGVTPIGPGVALIGASSEDEGLTYMYLFDTSKSVRLRKMLTVDGVAGSPYYLIPAEEANKWTKQKRKYNK
jgi:hypothetical protein